MRPFQFVTLTATLVIGSPECYPQNYPVKPIRLVVPWPPGGSNDVAARLIAPRLSDVLSQQVIVDNRGGAASIVGSDVVAKAVPDGYTIMLNSSTHAANAAIYSKLPYDTLKDFTLVSMIATQPMMIVVHPSLPVNTVQELVALAKSQPGRINYGSGGVGSGQHMTTVWFTKMAGVDMVHVPYKGGGLAVVALLGGEVKIEMASVPSVISEVKAGKLRAVAVTSAQRIPLLPEVPTVAQSGVPGYEMSIWLAIFGPSRLPAFVVGRLHSAVERAGNLPEVQQAFAAQGMQPDLRSHEQLVGFIQQELNKYAIIVKAIRASGERLD